MKKKTMEDIKPRGVRITKIQKSDIDSNLGTHRLNNQYQEPQAEVNNEFVPEKVQYEPLKIQQDDYYFKSDRKIYSTPRLPSRKSVVRTYLKLIFIIVFFLGAVYWVSYLLQNVNITITDKRESLNLNNTQFSASSDNSIISPIEFQIMIISDERQKSLTLTNSENVSQKAQGTITLFNQYNTKPQNIGIHSFVSDPSGKTYQTNKAMTIPGYTQDSTGNIVPGQVDADITAFLPGDAYNGSPTDFTLNGFKGTDKATKIYGKLKTPITGGAQGLVYITGPEDIGAVEAMAASSFKSSFLNKAVAQVPAGYILYPNAMQFSYTTNASSILSKTPDASVTIDGTMTSIILKKSDLSNAIIKKLLPDTSAKEMSEIQFPNINNLLFAFTDPNQLITKDLTSVSFSLSGPLFASWLPDIDALRSSIVGIPKKQLIEIFKQDPGIVQAKAKIFPPWQSYLPNNLSRIHITTE